MNVVHLIINQQNSNNTTSSIPYSFECIDTITPEIIKYNILKIFHSYYQLNEKNFNLKKDILFTYFSNKQNNIYKLVRISNSRIESLSNRETILLLKRSHYVLKLLSQIRRQKKENLSNIKRLNNLDPILNRLDFELKPPFKKNGPIIYTGMTQ